MRVRFLEVKKIRIVGKPIRFRGKNYGHQALSLLLGSFLFGTSPFPVLAQTPAEPPEVDTYQPAFEKFYQQALKFNPDMVVLQKQLHVSEKEIITAGAIPNPTVQLTWGWGKMTTQLGNPQQIGVQETVEVGPKRHLRIQIAQTQAESSRLGIRQFAWQLRSNLRLAYIDYLTAVNQLAQLKQEAQLFDQLSTIAKARFEAGAAPEAEALQARLARYQLNPQIVQTQGQIKQAAYKIYQWMGLLPPATDDFLPGTTIELNSLPQVPFVAHVSLLEQVPSFPTPFRDEERQPAFDTLQALSRQHRQELMMALNQVRQSQLALKLSQWQQLPDPQLGAGFLFVHTISPIGTSASDKETFYGGYGSVGFTLPVFRNQRGAIAKNNAQLQVDRQSLTSAQFGIDSALHQTLATIETQQATLSIFRNQLIPESMDVLKLADIGYRYGKTGLAGVILARQSYQAIQHDYLVTLTQTWQSWAALEQQAGLPLESLLVALNWPQTQAPYQQPVLPIIPASSLNPSETHPEKATPPKPAKPTKKPQGGSAAR